MTLPMFASAFKFIPLERRDCIVWVLLSWIKVRRVLAANPNLGQSENFLLHSNVYVEELK